MLPFTIDQFFSVFAAYNISIWPAQVAAYGVGALAFWGIAARRPWGSYAAASVLTIFWLWNGVAYHLLFFSAINPAAYLFGAAFILQGLLFFAYGVVADRMALRFRGGWHGALALALIVYAAVAYEVVGHFTGHGWPRALLFGVAPCPTTIFTFGMLMLSIRPLPAFLLAIPLLWAAVRRWTCSGRFELNPGRAEVVRSALPTYVDKILQGPTRPTCPSSSQPSSSSG